MAVRGLHKIFPILVGLLALGGNHFQAQENPWKNELLPSVASGAEEVQARYPDHGADGFLQKPFDLDQLRQLLARIYG